MPKKPSPPGSVYKELLRVAQVLSRAHDPKPSAPSEVGGLAKSATPATAYAALASQLALAEAAGKVDLLELARRAKEAAAARCRELRSGLEALRVERGDHEKRRRDLADVAQGYDWTTVHRETQDFIGPFRLDHSPERSRLFLGRVKLRVLEYPSGQEVFEAVRKERGRLEASARSVWPTLKAKVLSLQSSQGTVTWPEIKATLEQPHAAFRTQEPVVLYALVLLRGGTLEPRWSLSTQPPALAQQSRAVVLPRIDKPGSPDKVYAIRSEGPGAVG